MKSLKAFVSIALLIFLLTAVSGCGTMIDSLKPGLNKTEALAYPPSQYPELQLKVSGTENMKKEELESFRALIVEALKVKGGTVVVENDRVPKLIVEVLEISKENIAAKVLKLAITELFGGP